MPKIRTAYFGELDYTEETIFHFPYGLPGFEHEHAFLFLKRPHTEPLLFLQSLGNSRLCFILLPILVLDPNYTVNLDADDLAALHLDTGRQPRIGDRRSPSIASSIRPWASSSRVHRDNCGSA